MPRTRTSKILDKKIIEELMDSIQSEAIGKVDAIATELQKIDKDKRKFAKWKDLTNRALNKSSEQRNGAVKEVRDIIGRYFGYADWNCFINEKHRNLTHLLDNEDDKIVRSTVKKKFEKTVSKKENKTLPDTEVGKFEFEGFDCFYLYYYLGAEANVKPALLCFKKNHQQNDWENGRIYYVTDAGVNGEKLGYYRHSCTFNLERIEPAKHEDDGRSQFIYFKGICNDAAMPTNEIRIQDPVYLEKVSKYGNQVNFFTFHCGKNVIGERYLFFANTSVINRKETKTVDTPSIQLAVIRQVKRNTILEIMQSPVHPWIKNVLIGKRFDFSDTLECRVFKSAEAFNKEINILELKASDRPDVSNEQYYCSSQVAGIYIGFYLRQSFGPKGGLAFILLEVGADGNVECTAYDATQKEFVSYDGIFTFPVPTNKTTIVGDFINKHVKAKMCMFLKSENNTQYSGTISGLSNTHQPYTAAVVLYLINTKKSYTKLKKLYAPQRVPKERITELFENIERDIPEFGSDKPLTKVKSDLQKAEKAFFGLTRNCFP